LVLRRSNSGFMPATAPSSVVQIGVKSLGCENRIAQPSPIHSWNLIGPCVVWAEKSGAVSLILRVMWSSSQGFKGASSVSPSVLGEEVGGIAVGPALGRLGGGDHRVPAGVRVLGGMAVRRVVAAPRDAASLAGPQMAPPPADRDAVLAHPLGRLELMD